MRWLAIVYSILLLVTFGMAFVALQSFTASSSLEDAFGIPTLWSGIALTTVVGLVIFGGVKRIASVTEVVVPLMAVSYIVIALVVVVLNFDKVPGALAIIVQGAFGLDQAIGGGIGAAIVMGARRGLFSNEAGLGSGPNVAAVAWVPHPVNQGIVQALSVFIDTVIICTATAFIIVMSSVYVPGAENAVDGVVMTQAALDDHVGGWGRVFVSVALMLFAFSSILYNYYLGENSLNYFSEENKHLFNGFRIVILALTLWGSMQDLSTVFGFADLTMAFAALANIAALAMLIPVAFRLMRDYDAQRRTREYPVFDPKMFPDLNLDHEAWADAADAVPESRRRSD
jgi:AGCS family alanine or glycine:cation symporter